MEKKQWQTPELDVLDVSMTMNGKGNWIDWKRGDANPRTPGATPPES
ncbi:paeninodin family lasso peptide [Paenibacillus tarimensis]